MADIYDEAATARAGGRGNYLRSGRYKLLVEKIHELDTRGKTRGGLSIIAEFVVLSSAASGEREVAQDGKTMLDRMVEPNPVGARVSYVMSDKGAGAVMQPINLKSMVLGILQGRGATEAQITSKELRGATSAANPLRGYVVECEMTRVLTRESKKYIDVPNWKGYAQTGDDVKAWRSKLDKPGAAAGVPSTPAAKTDPQLPADPAPEPTAPPKDDGPGFLAMLD